MDIVNDLLSNFNLPENLYAPLGLLIKILIIILIAYFLIKISSRNSKIIRTIGSKFNRDNTASLFLSKLMKIIIITFAAFLIITELGYNINALVASLGIGGIVIALAAQDIAKNFFGGVTIITDKPFKVGDWVETKEMSGTIEDITIRSTRIRTFDGSLMILPNSTLANENVVNWGNMKNRRYSFQIYLPVITDLEKIDDFTTKAYELLENIPTVIDDSVHISFNEITMKGYEIKIMIDTTITAYREYLKFKELVNYKLMALMKKEGLSLVTNSVQFEFKED